MLNECNHRPAVIMQAPTQLPGTLAQLHVTARRDVIVNVTLDARGQPVTIKVLTPTHNRDLDSAAVRAANESTYSPAMVDCKPRPGKLQLDFTYDPASE